MEEKCTICLKNIKTKSSKTLLYEKFFTKCKCKYYYHNRCIKTWMKRKKTCPTCREAIFDNKYDKYKNSIKKSCWKIIIFYIRFILLIHKPFLFFICTTTLFSLIALFFLNLEAFMIIFLRKFLIYICYITYLLIIPTIFISQIFFIYRINLYIYLNA